LSALKSAFIVLAVLFAILLGIAIAIRNALEIFSTGSNFVITAYVAFYYNKKEKTKTNPERPSTLHS
jgi:succinate-acetate transporter protein